MLAIAGFGAALTAAAQTASRMACGKMLVDLAWLAVLGDIGEEFLEDYLDKEGAGKRIAWRTRGIARRTTRSRMLTNWMFSSKFQ